MIGIPSSNPALLLGSLAILACCAVRADEIVIEGDSHLSGTVSAITATGAVQLNTPLSNEPLSLRAGVVKRVVFADAPDAAPPGGTRLKLVGGDVLPCELRSLDDKTLVVSSAFAGDLQVPRTALSSLELGIHPEKALYSGPTGMEGWETDKWRFQDGQFVCPKNGQLSRAFELPDQFIIRFHLTWKGAPNFQFSFADALVKGGKTVDRYYLQFNSAGIEIKRQSTTSREYTSLLALGRQPESFPRSQMDIEIRVDRTQSNLWLYLDGVQEGSRFLDPVKPAPKGGGIAFLAMPSGDTEYRISGLKVMAWDAAGDRHRTEERGDTATDALITSKGDRYGGVLQSIRAGADGATLSFQSPLLEAPMAIPEKDVSTVFFKAPKPADPPATSAVQPLVLKLAGGGSLQVESCTFSGDQIQVKHALLGTLSMKRSSIVSMERASTSTAAKE